MRLSTCFRFLLFVLCLLSAGLTHAQKGSPEKDNSDVQFRAVAEAGYLAVLSHKIQLGENSTYFDYVDNGGQDVLFPTLRFSLEMDFNQYNTFILLYQPLRIETQSLLKEDLVANGTTFPANTGIRSLYNFPFYRISYLRELNRNDDNFDIAIGGSLQIRNATISFESTNGARYTDNRDVGIVPTFKIRTRYFFNDQLYTELEADGIYAPISVINGSDNEVVGAILDASLRLGARMNDFSNIYFNLRYLGGGAEGDSEDSDNWPGDGYTRNWLHFLNVTAGFVIHI